MSALHNAWNSDRRAETYDDLDETGRELRDEAYREIERDALAAVRSVDLDDLEEMHELLSWVDDVDAIFGPRPRQFVRDREGGAG